MDDDFNRLKILLECLGPDAVWSAIEDAEKRCRAVLTLLTSPGHAKVSKKAASKYRLALKRAGFKVPRVRA